MKKLVLVTLSMFSFIVSGSINSRPFMRLRSSYNTVYVRPCYTRIYTRPVYRERIVYRVRPCHMVRSYSPITTGNIVSGIVGGVVGGLVAAAFKN